MIEMAEQRRAEARGRVRGALMRCDTEMVMRCLVERREPARLL